MPRTASLLALAAACAGVAPLAAQTPAPAQPPAQVPATGYTLAPGQVPTVTLADAIRLADRVQPGMVQAQGNVQTAQARTRSATLGAYLPSLSVSSTGSNSHSGETSVNQAGTVVPGGTTLNSLNTSVSASIDLFTGFRRGADARAARASETAATASLVNARFQQALTTTNAFFDALAAQQLVGVREASVRRAEEQLKVAVAKLHAGSATRSDSLRSLVELGNQQLQLIQAQAALTGAEAALARQVGAPGRVAAADDSAFYHLVPVDTALLRQDAERNSPQVQSALAQASAADASIRSARAAYWPSLTLSGSLGWSGNDRVLRTDSVVVPAPRASITDFTPNRQIALQFRWSLFNGFQREQQITTAEMSADFAQAQADDARRALQSGLIAQSAQLDAAQAQVGITQTSVAAAREDLRVVQERYRLGASTIVDVLTSQENLNTAEVNVVTARFNYLRAKAQLEALIGHPL